MSSVACSRDGVFRPRGCFAVGAVSDQRPARPRARRPSLLVQQCHDPGDGGGLAGPGLAGDERAARLQGGVAAARLRRPPSSAREQASEAAGQPRGDHVHVLDRSLRAVIRAHATTPKA